MYNGEEAANAARDEFVNVVSNKGVPSDIPEVKLRGDTPLSEIVLNNGMCDSKGEFKRLIAQGAVKINDEKCSDVAFVVKTDELPVVIKVGKRKFVKAV